MRQRLPLLAILLAACGTDSVPTPEAVPEAAPEAVSTLDLVFSSRMDGEIEPCG